MEFYCSRKLYAVSFYPSSPRLLGCGGAGGELALWELGDEENLQGTIWELSERLFGGDGGEQQTPTMVFRRRIQTPPVIAKRNGASHLYNLMSGLS